MIYLSINGTRLDELVNGFVLESVAGREMLPAEITAYDIATRNGSVYQRKRFAARTLTINYGLIANNRAELIAKYKQLNDVLNFEQAEWVFSDDPNVYFVGTVGDMSAPTGIVNYAKQGEFSIFCADPYKYAVTETVVTSTQVTIDSVPVTVLSTNNDATAPSYPIFDVQFADDTKSDGSIGNNGDSGYVMVSKNGTDYSLQFGDDEEQNTVTPIATIDFRKASRGGAWADNTTLNLPIYSKLAAKPTGTTKYASASGVSASGYGTAQRRKWYGPMIVRSITPAPAEFELAYKQLFALSTTTATAKTQLGFNLVILYDSSNNPVYAVGLKKGSTTGTTGDLVYIDASGLKTLKTGIKCTKYGPFGRIDSETHKDGTTAPKIDDPRASTNTIKRIQRDDQWFILLNTAVGSFELGGYDECPEIAKIGLFFGKYSSKSVPTNNSILALTMNSGEIDLLNTFTSGDFLEVNTGSLEVLLNSKNASYTADVANDWQGMTVDKGENLFICQYSDWVVNPPTFTMRYRKRWL